MSFKIADAFVEVRTEDKTDEGRRQIGASMGKWAAGLGIGAAMGAGIASSLNLSGARAKLNAQMGLTGEDAAKAGKVAGEVYRGNFGDSLDHVNQAIRAVGANIGDVSTMSAADLRKVTEEALTVAQTFDVDVNDAARAAGAMIQNGMAKNSTEAFDIITRGFQSGADQSGDFLDTLNEYGPQFQKLGIDGPTAVGMISAGLKAGARDGDIMADAIKEFSIRAIDGSKSTVTAYKDLGLNAKSTAQAIAGGGPAAEKAMSRVVNALQGVKDPVKQNEIGVALFGTQWEDLGPKVLGALDPATASLDNVAGATARVTEEVGGTGAAKIETMRRSMQGWMQDAAELPGPLGDAGAAASVMGTQGLIAGAALLQVAPMLSGVATAAAGAALGVARSAVGMAASAATATASTVASVAVQAARWAWLGVQAMAAAARVALAWIISMGPIALVIAAVVGLVVLIVKYHEQIKKAISAAWDWVWGKVKAVGNLIVGFFMNWTLPGLLAKHWGTIQSKASAVWNAITSFVRAIPGRIVSFFQNWTLVGIVLRHWDQIKAGVTSKASALIGYVRGIPGRIRSALGNLGGLLVSAGRDILAGLIRGVTEKIGELRGKLSSVTGMIPDWKGPMDVDRVLLRPSGQAIMGGLEQGIDDRIGSLRSTLAGVTGLIGSAGGTMAAGITGPAVAGVGTSSAPSRSLTIHNLTLHVDGHFRFDSPSDERRFLERVRSGLIRLEAETA